MSISIISVEAEPNKLLSATNRRRIEPEMPAEWRAQVVLFTNEEVVGLTGPNLSRGPKHTPANHTERSQQNKAPGELSCCLADGPQQQRWKKSAQPPRGADQTGDAAHGAG